MAGSISSTKKLSIIFFFAALAAIYRLKEWRQVLILITAFTHIDESNNIWGNPMQEPSRLQMFKAKQQARGQSTGANPMQAAMQKGKKDF